MKNISLLSLLSLVFTLDLENLIKYLPNQTLSFSYTGTRGSIALMNIHDCRIWSSHNITDLKHLDCSIEFMTTYYSPDYSIGVLPANISSPLSTGIPSTSNPDGTGVVPTDTTIGNIDGTGAVPTGSTTSNTYGPDTTTGITTTGTTTGSTSTDTPKDNYVSSTTSTSDTRNPSLPYIYTSYGGLMIRVNLF
jgi:hypothetical protein